MILQALTNYYNRLSEEGITGIASAGFEIKEIPFIIVLNSEGGFVALEDTREVDGKNKSGARLFTIPKGIKKTNRIAANLLWDNIAYVLAHPRTDTKTVSKAPIKRAKQQQREFIAVIRERFPDPVADEGVRAVLSYLELGNYQEIYSHPAWSELEESGSIVTFRLEKDSCLVCQRPAVIESITPNEGQYYDEGMQGCLVTGKNDIPARLHTSIKGVWGAQSTGANIVSFNHDAFCSYGKKQGFNAPVGKRAEFAYTTAVNALLCKGSQQRLQIGDTSTIFWGQQKGGLEEVFADLFTEPSKDVPERIESSVRNLLDASLTSESAQFHVLSIAPNAGRLAIRFWYSDTVGNVVRHIMQHFADCNIVHGPNQPSHLSLFRLLTSTAAFGKAGNVQPSLACDLFKAIISGTSYSYSLLAAVILRCRKDREVTYPRAALIKAILVRAARQTNSGGELRMSLDTMNQTHGYLLGRLFSVLERVEEGAIRGLNATIRDRFYGTASSTPSVIFPHLMKIKNHHIAKIGNKGQTIKIEREIGEIMAGLQGFPIHLSLTDQGHFAIGYYHQRQWYFTKQGDERNNGENTGE